MFLRNSLQSTCLKLVGVVPSVEKFFPGCFSLSNALHSFCQSTPMSVRCCKIPSNSFKNQLPVLSFRHFSSVFFTIDRLQRTNQQCTAAKRHFSVALRPCAYRGSKGSKVSDEDEDEMEDEDEADTGMDISEMSLIAFKEDADLPNNYKELRVNLKSPRLDAIVGAGLSISRNKVDDIFLDSKLRHNGDRVLKKSKQLKEGDYIDVLMSAEEGVSKVKRVRVVKIVASDVPNAKLKVFIRAWRNPVSI